VSPPGEHTREVMVAPGVTGEEISALAEARAIQ